MRRAFHVRGQAVVELATLQLAAPLAPAGVVAGQILRAYDGPGQLLAAKREWMNLAVVGTEWGQPFVASLDQVARRSGVSKKTAERARAELVDQGVIRLLPRFRPIMEGEQIDLARYPRAYAGLRRLELAPAIVLTGGPAKRLREARVRRDPMAVTKRRLWRTLARAGVKPWSWQELRAIRAADPTTRRARAGNTSPADGRGNTGARRRRRTVDDPRLSDQATDVSLFERNSYSARACVGRFAAVGAAAPQIDFASAEPSSARDRDDEAREPAAPAPRREGPAAKRPPATRKHAAVAPGAAPERVFNRGGETCTAVERAAEESAGGAPITAGAPISTRVLGWLPPHLAALVRGGDE